MTSTTEWLGHLYGDDADGWLTLFALDRRPDAAGNRQRVMWTDADTEGQHNLGFAAGELAPACCVWFGVATRDHKPDKGRGSAADCQALPGLWLDIDCAGPGHKTTEKLPATRLEAVELLAKFALPPTAIVDSGGGLQAWWLFHDLELAQQQVDLLDRWQYTWERLAGERGWHIDNVSDLARVMRLPGTYNRKLWDDPKPVTVNSADWTRRYHPTDIDQLLYDRPQPDKAAPANIRVPYIGATRPGDAFNAVKTGGDLLAAVGFIEAHTDSEGVHWTRPGKDSRQGSSATVYNSDGHVTVWSDTVRQMWPAVELRRPYDPFGLYTALFHHGDHSAASDRLALEGYGVKAMLRDDLGWLVADVTLNGDQPRSRLPAKTSAKPDQQLPQPRRHVNLVSAATIEIRPVHWLLEGRIPQGALTLLGGREGIGKSMYAYDLASDVTRGVAPGIYLGTPKPVLIAATEDSWGHTIVPRLIAAKADLGIIYRIDVVTEEGDDTVLTLPADIDELATAVRQVGAGLILLDPLLSRLAGNLDTHKDADVRKALEPLTKLADQTGTALVGLIHVNKSMSTDPLTMLMGSRAFAAVARAVMFVMIDPETEGMRLLGQPKNNLGRTDLPVLRFNIENTYVTTTDDGEEVWTGKLFWRGESSLTLDGAIEAAGRSDEEASKVDECCEWLGPYLNSKGGVEESVTAAADGAKMKFSKATLKHARERLAVSVENTGFQGKWYWKAKGAVFADDLPKSSLPGGDMKTMKTMETMDIGVTTMDEGNVGDGSIVAIVAIDDIVFRTPREADNNGDDAMTVDNLL